MNKCPFLLLCLSVLSLTQAQDLHEDALTAASYAYSHSKKAHGANNVFHTQEYADKAVEAFQKVEQLSDRCGCSEAVEIAYEAKTDMESSLTQDSYERSRFYAKRAKELGSKLLEQLTLCQSNSYSNTAVATTTDNTSEKMLTLQSELAKKKAMIEKEQQELASQIAAQQLKEQQLKAKREAMLEAQNSIKAKAELALRNLENALRELGVALYEDKNPAFKSYSDYLRSENALRNESLDDTKTFYMDHAKELTKSAMLQFAGNTEN